MPPLDSMASMSPEDRYAYAQAMEDELQDIRKELNDMRAQQQASQMSQIASQSLSSTGPAAISGSYSYGAGGSYISPGRATISSGAMYAPPAPVDFIGPFNFAQMKLMENRLVGNWEKRPTATGHEYWFAPTAVYATQPKQTAAQMGEWQMGYEKGYEDGKAGK